MPRRTSGTANADDTEGDETPRRWPGSPWGHAGRRREHQPGLGAAAGCGQEAARLGSGERPRLRSVPVSGATLRAIALVKRHVTARSRGAAEDGTGEAERGRRAIAGHRAAATRMA